MTTDDVTRQSTDRWGRPVLDGRSQFGPLDGTDTSWPAGVMLVLGDDDVVACATGFARAFSSEYFFTIWLIVIDDGGWSTKIVVELLDLPPRPPTSSAMVPVLARLGSQLRELAPGSSVIAAIADPDGGDRGDREVAWSRAVLTGAAEAGVAVRGVVAVGAHRDRLLYSSAGPAAATWVAAGRSEATGEPETEADFGSPWEQATEADEATEWEEDDGWGPFADGPPSTEPLPAEIRDVTGLAVYASALYDASFDPEFVIHLLPLGPDGTVLWDPFVVHGLPDDPEPEDRDGLADLLQAVAVGALRGPRRAVAAILSMPDCADSDSAHAWAEIVRGAASEARVTLRGVVAVDEAQAVVLVRPEEAG